MPCSRSVEGAMKTPKCTKCNAVLDISEVTSLGLIVCSVCGQEFSQEWFHKQMNKINPDSRKTFVLDGSKIESLSSFYDEVHRVLCPSFSGFSRNWNALVDVLRGGFGTFEEGESVQVILIQSKNVEQNLSESEFRHVTKIFTEADNIEFVSK